MSPPLRAFSPPPQNALSQFTNCVPMSPQFAKIRSLVPSIAVELGDVALSAKSEFRTEGEMKERIKELARELLSLAS